MLVKNRDSPTHSGTHTSRQDRREGHVVAHIRFWPVGRLQYLHPAFCAWPSATPPPPLRSPNWLVGDGWVGMWAAQKGAEEDSGMHICAYTQHRLWRQRHHCWVGVGQRRKKHRALTLAWPSFAQCRLPLLSPNGRRNHGNAEGIVWGRPIRGPPFKVLQGIHSATR